MTATSRLAQNFVDTIAATYWTQHVKEATKCRGRDNPSLLDLVFTNDENMVYSLDVESPLGRSDHCTLKIAFKCYGSNQREKFTKYYLNRGNYKKFRDMLDLDWDEVLNKPCIDEQWNIFQEIFSNAYESCIPHKEMLKGKKSWAIPLDKHIVEKIKRKHRAWNRYMETRSSDNLREYTKCRNQVRKATRKAKATGRKT
jgi:hypothetical protein